MKKETVIAVVMGILFGVVLSVVMVSKTKDRQLENTKTLSKEKKVIAVPHDEAQTQTLTITSPQNMIITSGSSIEIKGTADKDTLVLVQSPIQDVSAKNTNGSFSVSMPLSRGENVIQITAYAKDPQERPQQRELHVFSLPE